LAQLWTIIFVAILAAAFALAHWHDCDEAKRRASRDVAHEDVDAREK
jgi:uncharacterized membrane protein YidH (DUF202 family)